MGEIKKWHFLAVLALATAIAVVAGCMSYEDRKSAEAEKAAKILDFQKKFDSLSPRTIEDFDEKIRGANWGACVAWINVMALKVFEGELGRAGLTFTDIQREEQFLVAQRIRASALADAVVHGKGILDCGESPGHVALVESAIDAVKAATIWEEPQPISGELRKVLIREITPFVKQALDFLWVEHKGLRPNFKLLNSEMEKDELTDKELGISWLERENIRIAAKE